MGAAIGLFHGLLITKIRLEPFVVTLCGLFLYRGLSRFITGDRTVGYGTGFSGLRFLDNGSIPAAFWPKGVTPPHFIVNWSLPMPFLLLIVLAIVLAIVLNKSVYGQHLKATGRNESAARFSGVHTHNTIIVSYVLSSAFAAFGGILFSLDLNSVQPSSLGSMYELYAIAGCVVGGVSLRGGEGSIVGVHPRRGHCPCPLQRDQHRRRIHAAGVPGSRPGGPDRRVRRRGGADDRGPQEGPGIHGRSPERLRKRTPRRVEFCPVDRK